MPKHPKMFNLYFGRGLKETPLKNVLLLNLSFWNSGNETPLTHHTYRTLLRDNKQGAESINEPRSIL